MSGEVWWRRYAPVDEMAVRAEIWGLGVRHQGQPLDGALEELKAPGLAPHRARLLRACIRRLRAH